MRAPPALSADEREKVDHLATTLAKPTAAQIAGRLGLNNRAVYWYMLRNGLLTKAPPQYRRGPFRRNGRTIQPYTQEHDARINALSVAGRTVRQIADTVSAEFGIPRTYSSIKTRLILMAADDEIAP